MSTAPVSTATATATVTGDGSVIVELDGQPPHQLKADDQSQARHQAVELVIAYARHIGQPVTLLARDSDTSHLLQIHPDGTVHPAETAPAAQHGPGSAPSSSAGPPMSGRPRRSWPLVAAAAATALAVSAALWLRPAADNPAVPTPESSTAPVTAADPTPAPGAVDADTLGAAVAARSAVPHTVPLPVSVAPVAWNGAAAWQARRTRQAAQQPVATWTATPNARPAPVPAASDTATAPTSRTPATAQPTRPQVIINPDESAAAPRRAPKQPAGPARPDQPSDPTNPN